MLIFAFDSPLKTYAVYLSYHTNISQTADWQGNFH